MLRVGMRCRGFYLAATRLANGTQACGSRSFEAVEWRVADRRSGGELFNAM
jgi:hypothetical protein